MNVLSRFYEADVKELAQQQRNEKLEYQVSGQVAALLPIGVKKWKNWLF
jgi:hypothetical protein